MSDFQTISPAQLDNALSKGGVVLDVRSKMEHAEKRLKRAHMLVPLDELRPADFLAQHNLASDARLYLLCKGGVRATQAAERFIAAGCHNIHVIQGGIIACEKCGLEVKGYAAGKNCSFSNGKNPVSLERQIRITAGLITATGALLALTAAPAFAFIPLFVGCGLIFAGITDRCGMAMLLTKAPWNKS